MLKFLANLSIRTKFLILPTIAAALMLALGAIFLGVLKNEHRLLNQITHQEVPKMRELSRLFSEFSTNHVRFINLLAASLRRQTQEGEFYALGRKNIILVQKISAELEGLETAYRLDQRQQAIADELQHRLAVYHDQMGDTVLMSSVELGLIAQFTLRANEAYDAANNEFLKFNDAVQEGTRLSVYAAQSSLRASEYQFFIILGTVMLFIVVLSMLLSTLFTADLKSTISILSRLAGGDTNVALPAGERRDEFGAVDRAMRVFREALLRQAATEQSLRLSEERFRTLFEDNPLMLLTVDAMGMILSINRRGARQIGYTTQELVGTSVLDQVLEEDKKEATRMIRRCTMTPGVKRQWTLRKRHKDGTVLWLRITGQSIQDGAEPVILLVCEDVTETHKLSEQLSYQATHDSLTGLINRWEFERRLIHVLTTAKSDQSEHVLCFLDLDQFKIINDTCGHGAGDELLRQLAEVLKGNIRSGDALARLGGDEFAILLEHCSLSSGWRSARGILTAIEDYRFAWGDRQFRVGASIGMVLISEISGEVADVMANADAACYVAKEQGRNRIHVYMENDEQMTQRRGEMLWATRIPDAIEKNEFELFCQAIVPLTPVGGEGRHFEFLLRLKDMAGGWVIPSLFLPAAERYNLSPRLDRWIVGTAFEQLSRFGADNPVYKCAINLSGNSFGDKEFLKFVLDALKKYRIAPQTLCFEITETAAISNLTGARQFIEKLKGEGAYFSLDDFGTGLSSFAYLKELPVDFLKIDGVFVRGIANDPIQYAMVKSINDIGHVMGMRTIAEFVENEAILERLREIGVDYAQGFHIDKPRPAGEFFTSPLVRVASHAPLGGPVAAGAGGLLVRKPG